MSEGLEQSDLEELSAYLDDELPPDRAERVRRKVESDPAWADALAELRSLNARLDAWTPPEAPGDLSERIIQAAPGERRRKVLTLRRVLATTATVAAAAVIIAVTISRVETDPPVDDEARTAQSEPKKPSDTVKVSEEAVEEFAVENLGFFSDYDVLEDFETLRAIERAERSASSGT
ncbi:MAG: anti-sigma factor family protein [Phycisphaerae bacterium]